MSEEVTPPLDEKWERLIAMFQMLIERIGTPPPVNVNITLSDLQSVAEGKRRQPHPFVS